MILEQIDLIRDLPEAQGKPLKVLHALAVKRVYETRPDLLRQYFREFQEI